jgi:hypothetical protein
MACTSKSGSLFTDELSGHCSWMHTAWEFYTCICHWNGNREGEVESYRDCWIALTADDPERKASTVSVVALAFSSIIIYTQKIPISLLQPLRIQICVTMIEDTSTSFVTWSWTRNWKFDSCSICVSYNFFFFKHWIAAATTKQFLM